MRTTLDISDDVLFAAIQIAWHDGKTLGQVISDLARQAFARRADASMQANMVSEHTRLTSKCYLINSTPCIF